MRYADTAVGRGLGLVSVLLAGALLIAPPVLIVVQARSPHWRWSWEAPGRALLSGLIAVAATVAMARVGLQLWDGRRTPRWTVVGILLALLIVAALGDLLLLRSGALLVGRQAEVIG